MTRLTGFALLARVNVGQECGESRDFIARDCGYIRENGKVAYTAFYEELIKVKAFIARHKIMTEADQKPGSEVTSRIVDAIKNRKYYKFRSDEVWPQFGIIDYYHHGKLMVRFSNNNLHIFNPPVYSKSTKERLNRILMHFTGYKLLQKNKKWFIIDPFTEIPYDENTIDILNWNNPV